MRILLAVLGGVTALHSGCGPVPAPGTPGPACPAPEVDLARRLGLSSSGRAEVRWERERVDLDGDGVPDLLLAERGYCGSGGCAWHVYRVRAGCARWSGAVDGRLGGTRPGPGGVRDLLLQGWAGSCDTEDRVYRFDGQAYRLHARRRCRCTYDGDASPAAGCAPWSVRP